MRVKGEAGVADVRRRSVWPSADIRGANKMLQLQPAFRTLSGAPILRLE